MAQKLSAARRLAPLILFLLLLLDGPLSATEIAPLGEQIQVNTKTGGGQNLAIIESDEAGNFVTVFNDGNDLRARRFDAFGLPIGDDFLVDNDWNSIFPELAVAPQGAFVVVWRAAGGDADGTGIRAQRFDAQANALGADVQINELTTGGQTHPSVDIDAQGRFAVTWHSAVSNQDDDDQTSIQARWFDSDGTPRTGDVQVNTFITGDQETPAIAVAADGSSVIAWVSAGSDPADRRTVQVRRFDSDGNPLGDPVQANTDPDETAFEPTVALAEDGSFVVAWQDGGPVNGDDLPLHIDARFFGADGEPVGDQFQVDDSSETVQHLPAVASRPGGGFWVTWAALDASTAGSTVVLRELLDTGLPVGPERVVDSVDVSFARPDVTSLLDGDLMILWQDETSVGDDRSGLSIQGRRFGELAFIAGRVFSDLDFDALQDPGEPGVAGVNVHLRGPLGDLVASTTTDSAGRYLFRPDLEEGLSFFLDFEAPAGQAFTAADQGGDDGIDSDVDPASGETPTFELDGASELRRDFDGGLIADTAVIGDRVWLDHDFDGFQDQDESGVAGVTLRLLDTGGQVVQETFSDSEGFFAFADAPTGSYSVEIELPEGFGSTHQNLGDEGFDSDFDPDTRRTDVFLYAAGTIVRDIDAGVAPVTLLWNQQLGDELTELTDEDDDVEGVALSFPFPFEGFSYQTVFVGTNGCLQLGTLGADEYIPYDYYQNFEGFYADDDGEGDPEPVICPFGSDLAIYEGSIHVSDLGDRAIFTWLEVGTYEENAHLLTFQVQLLGDGTIIFSYNGVLDGEGEDLIESLDGGIVVGVSLSDGSFPSPESNPDLSSGVGFVRNTVYQRWCYDEADSCGEDDSDLGYAGETNDAFDLDHRDLVFTPVPGGGFVVSEELIDLSTLLVFNDSFESGDLSAWSAAVP